MSHKTSLDCQSVKCVIVIRNGNVITKQRLLDYCNTYCKEYSFIEHKNDLDNSTGQIIPTHYHLVVIYKDSRIRFSSRLNTICQFFGFDNAIGIQIDKCNDYVASLQYLIHKNDSTKTQHNINEVVTNIEQSDFTTFMTSSLSGTSLTYEMVYVACLENTNIYGLIKSLGVTHYKSNRAWILDMWYSIKTDKK